jgi:hypothetical protein
MVAKIYREVKAHRQSLFRDSRIPKGLRVVVRPSLAVSFFVCRQISLSKGENMEDSAQTKPQKKLYKRWWFWVVIGIILLIAIMVLGSSGSSSPKELRVIEGERVSISGISLGIGNSSIDGSGEITNFDCLVLSKIALRNGGDFYDDNSCRADGPGFIAKSSDSAQSKVITIYPASGTGSIVNCKAPTATFTFNKDMTELASYSFEEKECFQGAKLPISSVDVRTVQELSKYGDEHQYKR